MLVHDTPAYQSVDPRAAWLWQNRRCKLPMARHALDLIPATINDAPVDFSGTVYGDPEASQVRESKSCLARF
jgi:hypothetical protein